MSAPRPRIVLLGMMAKTPVPGVIWQTIHYLLGFERLGYEAYYVEAHGRTPTMLMQTPADDGPARAAHLIDSVMRRFDLGDRWAYRPLHGDDRSFGIGDRGLAELYRGAELVVNLHGGTPPRPEMYETGRLIYLETDPVQLQIELHDGVEESFAFLEPHSAFFTFAENMGAPDSGLPVSDRFDFRPTRQPVLVDMWAGRSDDAGGAFTTVANWRQPWREVSLQGEKYSWSKDREWSRFTSLPELTGERFELALSSCGPGARAFLERRGWGVRAALDFSTDLNAYRDFIGGSRGEFTVAKDQNVRLRTGWFSDRSATYLAAGRPVVMQDTGFGAALPTGEGLFAVSDVGDAAAAIAAIGAEYPRHRAAAHEIAREHFDAEHVLGRLLDDLGLPRRGRPGTGAAQNPTSPDESGANRPTSSRTTAMTATSVIIPCFNLGEFLREAVDSVDAQTRPPDELIVVDDGSTDEATLDVLNELRERGVMVYRTPNRGAPSARNYGVEHAIGDYVLCLDADDVLLPSFLERTAAAMDAAPDAGIVATQVEMFGTVNGLWKPPQYSPHTMLWRNCLPSASLFRRRCWRAAGGYAPDLDACQDWDLWMSILERGWKWRVVEEPLYRYRRREGSISERREADRPRILADMMHRHEAFYAEHAIEAIIDVDTVLKTTNERLQRFKRDNTKQAERLKTLEEAARPPEDEQVAGFRRFVETHVPEGATALVVTKGDDNLLRHDGRRTWHFPRTAEGAWPGHHPQTDEEAIEMLEALRAEGAEYLCFPPKERWWFKRYETLRKYLSQTYSVIARGDGGVIYDVREPIRKRSFSVVISTYKRPELVAEAMRSVFRQDYPRDRFELIVVNNDSPDDTEQIVLDAGREATVPFTYLVEKRNGLSYARNTGMAAATGDFICFLDDDAIACRDWMATFNGVIDEHHALVVGGRVEKAFEEGFETPKWFDYQYVKHFFGVNYRDRNRKESVFRIRYPLYVTGANLIYARKLFDHFPGFDPRLGRDGKSLLGGEESYMNMVLDKHDIPIYYTDDAWVAHHIQSYRVTKEHLRSKAWWSGITNAVMHPMFFGFDEVRERKKNSRAEIKRRLREIRKEPRSSENFMRELRLIYNVAFLWKFTLRDFGHRFGRHRVKEPEVTWGLAQWIAETHGWTDSVEKYERLRVLGREAGDDTLVAEAERWLATRGAHRDTGIPSDPVKLDRAEYDRMVRRVRQRIAAAVPPTARVAVATKGDDTLLELEGRRGHHFPQQADGTYAGFYPHDDEAAIAHVEELRRGGVTHLVFPATAIWWHSHYRGLASHLDRHHDRILAEPETVVIYRLVGTPADRNGAASNGGGRKLLAALNGRGG